MTKKTEAIYFRVGDSDSTNVWGLTDKCGSTSLNSAFRGERNNTRPREGDHVKILVRHPCDRLVSGWKWFTTHHNSYLSQIYHKSAEDHEVIMGKDSTLEEWFEASQRHWNTHWAPQTELHPLWRQFELIDLADCPFGHEKKTREDNSWEQYFTSEDFLARVLEYYKSDLELWNECKNVDTTGRRVTKA